MSAIAGFWHLDNRPVDHADLESMSSILSHQGMDDAGMWSDSGVSFIHRMLWTTPESLHEKLPFAHPENGLVITADARIDNRDELIRELGLNQDVPDSQVILSAYQKWGEACPEKLIGDFAFVIWDSRRQTLFGARDPLGVKPLYYYHNPHKLFIFASEIKGLFVRPEVPRTMNEIMVADYLALYFEDKANTFYENIFRLPAAHSFSIGQGGLRLQSYWQLDPDYELRLRSDDEYHEQYREIFTEAIRCRMRSAFPIGTALSGGIDSSSIACVARDIKQQTDGSLMPTFSVIFDDVPDSDERPFINAVLEKGGFDPHFIPGDQISPFIELEKMLWYQDGMPFFAPQYFLHWAMWQSAQKQGVRIFMDGLIGDNTTSQGVGYLYELAYQWRWIKLAQELQGASQFWSSMPVWKRWWGFVKNHGIKPAVPGSILNTYRNLRGNQAPVWKAHPLIQPEFVRRVGLEKRVQPFMDESRVIRSERQMHHQLLTTGLISHGFEITYRSSAAFGIESRFPFTDRRLVEFCLALPARLKIHHGYGRMIARHGLAHTLPEKIRWRQSKGDLGPNFERGLEMFERQRLENIVQNPVNPIKPYVNTEVLQRNFERYRKISSGDNLRHFWAAVMFDQSLRYQETFFRSVQSKEVIAAST